MRETPNKINATFLRLLPTFSFFKSSYMRRVMTRVPCVKRQSSVKSPITSFRMTEFFLKIVRRHGI